MSTHRLLNITAVEHAETHGNMLAGFLNAANRLAPQSSAAEIFQLCRELSALRGRMPAPPWPTDASTPEITEYVNSHYRLMKAVNEKLGRYRFRPVLAGHEHYRVDWMPASRGKLSKRVIGSAQNSGALSVGSLGAVNIILEMTANGTIDRVRECICGRWFFAASNKKQVCSDACRFKKYKQQDEEGFNKKRAEYMKGYYKNPKVKAKREKEKRNAEKTK